MFWTIHRFALSADGSTAVFGNDSTLRWLDPTNPGDIGSFRAPVDFWTAWGLAASVDGSLLLCCSFDARGHVVGS